MIDLALHHVEVDRIYFTDAARDYLAVEAWTRFPDLMKTLPDVLPTEEAKKAYDDRIKQIASTPQVRRFAREQLSFFFVLSSS